MVSRKKRKRNTHGQRCMNKEIDRERSHTTEMEGDLVAEFFSAAALIHTCELAVAARRAGVVCLLGGRIWG